MYDNLQKKFNDLILQLTTWIFLFLQKLITENYLIIWLDVIFIILTIYRLNLKSVKFSFLEFMKHVISFESNIFWKIICILSILLFIISL